LDNKSDRNAPGQTAPAVRFVTIDARQSGQRLDNYLLKTLKTLPKGRLYRIIRKGEVRVNKKRVKPDYRLQSGDLLRIPPIRQDQPDTVIRPPMQLVQELEARILHEDGDLLVLDKPSGLAVHSGSGLRFGAIDVLRLLRPHSEIELVHRLDRDTSGCLLFAFHRRALLDLQRQLQSGAMIKTYEAVVHGRWNPQRRSIDRPLKRQSMPNGERRVCVDAAGQPAGTRIEACESFGHIGIEYSCLQLRLMTGRTHQIRVHCQSEGHPLIGDDKYGDRPRDKALRGLGIRRLMLHARALEFDDARGHRLRVLAPRPPEFETLCTAD